MCVVELLQVVDVEEEQRKRHARGLRALDLGLGALVPMATIADTRDGILERAPLERVEALAAAIADSDGENGGEHEDRRLDADARGARQERRSDGERKRERKPGECEAR